MSRFVIVDYGKQNGKLDPKFYPLIWIGLVFATLFSRLYDLYYAFAGEDMNPAQILINIVVQVIASGVLPAILCYYIPAWFHRDGAKRGLFAIPRNDFIYFTMIFMAISRVVVGVVRIFGFLDYRVSYCTELFLELFVVTVAMMLMYFLVLAPKYLSNPYEKHRYFKFYFNKYMLWAGVLYMLASFVFIVSFEALNSAEYEEVILSVLGSYVASGEEEIFLLALAEIMYYMSISSYVTIGVYAVALVAYIVLEKVLDKKGKAYKEAHPQEFVERPMWTTNGRPQSSPFEEQKEENPFGNEYSNNSNDNDNPFGDY